MRIKPASLKAGIPLEATAVAITVKEREKTEWLNITSSP
jgi:hypothetical protein